MTGPHNNTSSVNIYTVANALSSTAVFVDVFMNRDPTVYDVNYPVQKKWFNTTTSSFWILEGFNASAGSILANWQKIGSGGILETLTGNTGPTVPPSGNNINVVGDGVFITTVGNAGSSTLTIEPAGGLTTLYQGNVGTATPSGGTITFTTGNSNINGTAIFSASGATLTLIPTTAAGNTGWGFESIFAVTSGVSNTAYGKNSLANVTSGNFNTAIGLSAGQNVGAGGKNTFLGFGAGKNNVGTENLCAGYQSGINYTTTESNNITLGNIGTALDSGVIRIGDPLLQTSCFVSGVTGVGVTGSLVACSTGGQFGVPTLTAYGVLTGGTTSTGPIQSVTPGATGTVLTSNGAAALPSWESTSAAGNLVLIQSQTATASTSLAFTTGITATYNNYVLLISNLTMGTNNQNIEIQISTNGGSTYIASGYTSGLNFIQYNATTVNNVTSSTFYYIMANASSTLFQGGTVWFYNFTSGDGFPSYYVNSPQYINGNLYNGWGAGNYPVGSTTVNAFQIIPASGNIATGTFTLYGVLE